MSSEFFGTAKPFDPVFMNKTLDENGDPMLNFRFYINDNTYDNDDNPYATVRLHIYTNMDNASDTEPRPDEKLYEFYDHEVPLVPCPKNKGSDWSDAGLIRYCPVWNKDHFMYGTFFSNRYSWQRIVVHFCDDSPEA